MDRQWGDTWDGIRCIQQPEYTAYCTSSLFTTALRDREGLGKIRTSTYASVHSYFGTILLNAKGTDEGEGGGGGEWHSVPEGN